MPDPPALIDEPDEAMHETIAPGPSVLGSNVGNVIENEGARSSVGPCTPDTSSEWELTWTPTSPIAPDISALRSWSPDPYSWSELLRRVFSIDVLHCTHCGGSAKLIAFITDPPVIRRILSHLRLPTDSPAVAPARPPPQTAFDF